MNDVAIRVENLGKRYRIGEREPYKALRDTITDGVKAPFRAARSMTHRTTRREQHKSADDAFWALRNVSFEVKRGEVIGIIGRNGAGKSTLLKILSRVTEPTEGHAVIDGRIGSLLEVGTGFHPELTGRENIFLNGAILGMSQREIRRKFDEIVDFAGVEKFLDTPVKRFSSGMYVRLAFAVAAHLEPEILLVDEVLAVGDAAFQKKCLERMDHVAHDGATVLFVSHNMSMLQALCTTGVWLESGHVESSGCLDGIVSQYLNSTQRTASTPLCRRNDRDGSGEVYFTNLQISGVADGNTPNAVRTGMPMCIEATLQNRTSEPLQRLRVTFTILDSAANPLFACATRQHGYSVPEIAEAMQLSCTIPELPLVPGRYFVNVAATRDGARLDRVERAAEFVVRENDVFGTGRMPTARKHGQFVVSGRWSCRQQAENRRVLSN